MNGKSASRLALCFALLSPTAVWAAHPLTTDDAGTQGRGNFQLEVNGQYDHDKESGVTTTGEQAATSLTYGIADSIDIAVGVPYLWLREKSDLGKVSENGPGDTSVDVKLRFYEHEGLSLAVKPGLSLPTGDEDKGLGTGKVGYHLYFIAMKEIGPWSFIGNLGYIRNESDVDTDETDIWHVSVAGIYSLNEKWKIAADLVADRNTDKDGDSDPVSAVAGVIYSPAKDIDLDLGLKRGLTSAATDWSVLGGATFRF